MRGEWELSAVFGAVSLLPPLCFEIESIGLNFLSLIVSISLSVNSGCLKNRMQKAWLK